MPSIKEFMIRAFPSASATGTEGMTLRDYFAAAALQGMLANREREIVRQEDAAELAYTYADAMLDERGIQR